MTTRAHFRDMMAQRRPYRNDPRYSIEWQYLTRAAAYLLRYLKTPVTEWRE